MIGFFQRQKGTVSIFLVIVLVPIIAFSSMFVDLSRIQLSKAVISSAGDLALNTVLTQYDQELNEFYGLMASSQSIDEFLGNVEDYYSMSIASQGIDTTEARKYASKITGIISGEREVTDILKMALADEASVEVTKSENGSLANPALMKTQIVEFMKYRSPINAAATLLESLLESKEDLEGAAQNTELIEKKRDFYEAEGAVCEKAYEVYLLLMEYKNLGINEEYIQTMLEKAKKYEEKYLAIHTTITKNLFNTQGSVRFEKKYIDYNQTEDRYDSDHLASAGNIKNYLRNTCIAMQRYLEAKDRLETTLVMRYEEGKTWRIQYWVQTVQLMEKTKCYTNYYNAAEILCKNYAQLENAVSNSKEGALETEYTLSSLQGVDAKGKDTLESHYDTVESQYNRIKRNYFEKDTYLYNDISSLLWNISDQAISTGAIDPKNTEEKIKAISKEIKDYYEKIEEGFQILTEVVPLIEELDGLVKDYQSKKEVWKTTANSYSTQMAQDDREEIANLEENEFAKITPETIASLVKRINDVKSLFGTLKKGLYDIQYNKKAVYTLDTYRKVRDICGLEESKLSTLESELISYAKETFEFYIPDEITTINVTEKNNPDIHGDRKKVGLELYDWIYEKFRDSSKIDVDQGKKDYEGHKKESGEEVDKIGEDTNSTNTNEIVKQANLASTNYYADLDSSEITSSLSKIGSFVSGLFTNLGGTLSQMGVDIRDDLYITDYITSMFTFDTYENEGKYELATEQLDKEVTLSNYKSVYGTQDVLDLWKSEELTHKYNKTLTNMMLNETYNWSYQNEAEYILYGKENKDNKNSMYGAIFMTRFALNLPAEYSLLWGWNTEEGRLVNMIADGIATATYGIIPAALVKIAIIIAVNIAECAYDIKCLKAGIPVIFVKKKEDLAIRFTEAGNVEVTPENKEKRIALQYSQYLQIFMFIKLLDSDKANGIYTRTADVIQVNMNKKIVKTEFQMAKSQVYYQLNTIMQVPPLMLKLPINTEYTGDVETNKKWYTISYESIKGY